MCLSHWAEDQLLVELVLVVVEVLDKRCQLHLPRQGNDLCLLVCSTLLLPSVDSDLLDEFSFSVRKLFVVVVVLLLLLHIVQLFNINWIIISESDESMSRARSC